MIYLIYIEKVYRFVTERSNTMGILPMDIDILPPCDDRIFKLILTAPEAKPALLSLIPAIIHRPVTDVIIRNNEIPPGDVDEKAERFDINCKTEDGTQIDIEMQASRIEEPDGGHENLIAKSIYYLCDLHSSQTSKGRPYHELAQSYQVTFCGYTIFPHCEDFINSFSMRHDKDNQLLTRAINTMFVELSKLSEILKKPISEMTDLEKWSVFLRYAENPDHREVVNKVIESKEGLAVAGELLMSVSKDERERAVFRSRKMFQTDMESNRVQIQRNIAAALNEGIQQGMQRGMTAGKITIAQSMLLNNEPLGKIILYTNLTPEEIESLRTEQ